MSQAAPVLKEPEHTIADLCARSHAISKEKGWVTEKSRPFAEYVILMHSEISEALEDWRANRGLTEIYYEHKGNGVKIDEDDFRDRMQQHLRDGYSWEQALGNYKPCGIPIEIADVCIRICQYCGTEGLVEELQITYDHAMLPPTPMEEMTFEDFLAHCHYCISMSWKRKDVEGLGRVFSWSEAFCELNGIDLWAAIDKKESYNRTRPFRHGNKRC